MTTISVDVAGVLPAVARVEGVYRRMGNAVVRGVNTATTKARERTVTDVVGYLHLPRGYVDERVKVKREATEKDPRAVIAVPVRGTLLTRFGASTRTRLNDWNEEKYKRAFGSLTALVCPGRAGAPRMPWTTRKGNAALSIPAGRKSDGVKVVVKRFGATTVLKHAYVASMRNGNGLGVFMRPSRGAKPKAVYGPSVYQIARRDWKDHAHDLKRDLRNAVSKELEGEMK